MHRKRLRVAGLCLAAVLAPTAAAAQRHALFDFQTNFWVNLHHFLYVTARARLGLDANRPSVMSALADTAGLGARPMEERRAWERCIAYYDSALARKDVLFDSSMVAIDDRLARLGSARTLPRSDVDPRLVAVLERAAPIYRQVWWGRHAAADRRWIARMRELVSEHGDDLAADESRVFREPWPRTPLLVDVVAYANWAGAYTTTDPSLITVGSLNPGNQNDEGLEILFHEALHTMDDTLAKAVVHAFAAAGKRLPRDVTHVFIFYTAGVLVQRAIPGHVPYAQQNGLWTRVPDFAKALPVLRDGWQQYIDGHMPFDVAIQRYVAAM